MKINTHKIVKLGSTFFAVCSLVLFCFCPRVHAFDLELITPERIYPHDYIVDTVLDGDSKTVTYRFDDTAVRVNLWGSPSGAKISSLYLATGSTFKVNLSSTSLSSDTGFSSRVYVFGSEAFDGQAAPVGVLDISDIMPGASLDLTLDYDLTFEYLQGAVTQAQVVMSAGVFCYDSAGSYLKTVYFSDVRETINFNTSPSSSQIVSYDPECMLTLDPGVSLILPFTSYNFTILDGKPLSACNVYFTPEPFDLSCDINMVYENSQTMDAIKDQLGDISQGIQDTNDKLDDTNDKLDDANQTLDDILTGGEYADESKEHSDKLTGSSGLLSDAVDKMVDASKNLPASPDLGDVMDDDTEAAVDDAISNASLIFDWESSGLFNMFVPMGLSVSLSVLFYAIFGKRG